MLPYWPICHIQLLHNYTAPWGEEFVWGEDDLIVPDLLQNRLKMLFPAERMRSLTKQELDQIRAIIYPVVEIEVTGREPFVLDQQQEKIVAEPVRVEAVEPSQKARRAEQAKRQEKMFEVLEPEERQEDELPVQGERISRTVAIRLVRGFSGSGKTLVLMQRAKFLAAQYPDWDILVLTFNKPLQEQLESAFKGTSIKPRTFHSICQSMLHKQGDPFDMKEWLDWNKFDYPIIRTMGIDNIMREINWLRDMGLTDQEAYLQTVRHGIGKDIRLTAEQRGEVFEVLLSYRTYLQEKNRLGLERTAFRCLESIKRRKAATKNLRCHPDR